MSSATGARRGGSFDRTYRRACDEIWKIRVPSHYRTSQKRRGRVNHKRVERIWRKEGLKVPKKQPKRGRLWLNDGSCIRLRPEHKNHVWSYDFMTERTHDGRAFRILNILDEYTRECLDITVERSITTHSGHRTAGTPLHHERDTGPYTFRQRA